MMNSTVDEFGENPFRSSGGGSGDLFFDDPPPTTTAGGNSFGGNFQPQQQLQQPMSFQQQPMSPASDPFAPQPQMSNFPPPSGPMQQMSPPRQENMQPQQAAPTTYWGNCMACLTLDSYKTYFDIDAEDIVTRVKAVVMDFYKPEHFRNNVLGVQKTDASKGPDLYGPFWITMTLIFLIGVSNTWDGSTAKSTFS